jgi:ketosteroid isomerase-like protein
MRSLFVGGIIALLLLPVAQAAEEADESKILALENAWNQAQLHHNSTAVASMLPDTFIYTDYDGTVMNKTQFLADLKDTAYQATLVANENVKVFTYQGAAVVIGTYHTKGKYKGRPFEHWGRFTDTWVFENKLWLCVASHTTLIKK